MIDRKWTLEELRAHLDRKPPIVASPVPVWSTTRWRPWMAWFDADGNFLGNRSGAVHKEDGDE